MDYEVNSVTNILFPALSGQSSKRCVLGCTGDFSSAVLAVLGAKFVDELTASSTKLNDKHCYRLECPNVRVYCFTGVETLHTVWQANLRQ